MICTFSAFLARPATATRLAISRASSRRRRLVSTTTAPPLPGKPRDTRSSLVRLEERGLFCPSVLLITADFRVVILFAAGACRQRGDDGPRREVAPDP